MTPITFIDSGLIAGGFAILSGSVCLLALRGHRVAVEQTLVQLQSELRSMLQEHKHECSAQIEQALAIPSSRDIAVVEPRVQNDGELKGTLARSIRSQAIQLLRSGMSPERAASALGVGRREMLLIASVSRALSLR